jgi:hypothetical protein
MPRGRLTFRERDVTAAIRAAERSGRKVARVRIGQDGSIEVDLEPSNGTTPDPDYNPYDDLPGYGNRTEKAPMLPHPAKSRLA